ncbi:MAG: hypothetical protein MPJ50_17195, partial [Pirellulales bacterium]|nr:hypothetical protein [Pirellulales bacterium]
MPKLSRLRFVSIGHLNARFDDITLDLRDDSGHATDTVLWLRNGGGKSSLLNLFYSGIRPHQREFLGSSQDKKELKEYVKQDDRSVVVYEWELDGKSGQLSFEDHIDTFLTGAFYEHRNGKLKRLFFSCRVSPEHSELTLGGLPIFRRDGGGVKRRNLSSFREEWSGLQKKHPAFKVTYTEGHEDWKATLNDAGIDTELFRYQLTMNRREGGADELFRFTSHEAFVDFLLELVLDPSLGSRVQKNIEQHRKDLRKRVQHYRPESELLAGLVGRLGPMQTVAESRQSLRLEAHQCDASLQRFIEHSDDLGQQVSADSTTLARYRDDQASLANEVAEQSESMKRQAATLRHVAATLHHAEMVAENEQQTDRRKQADRMLKVWNAAIPLRNAQRFERKAKQNQERLQELEAEHKPLHDQLCAAADMYASALTDVIDNDAEAIRKAEQSKNDLHGQVSTANRRLTELASKIATLNSRVAQIKRLLDAAESARKSLVANGVLQCDESGQAAVARWNDRLSELDSDINSSEAKLIEYRKAKEEFTKQNVLEENKAKTFKEERNRIQQQLDNALSRKQQLESNALLLNVLEADPIDINKLTQASWQLLRDKLEELLTSIVSLKISK